MVDLISNPDSSWPFDDDFDLGFPLQDNSTTTNCQQNRTYMSTSGSDAAADAVPPVAGHDDILFASNTPAVQYIIPTDCNVMVNDIPFHGQFIDNYNAWGCPTPSGMDTLRDFSLGNHFSGQVPLMPVEAIDFNALHSIPLYSHPNDASHCTDSSNELPASANTADGSLLQHPARMLQATVAAPHPRKHVCNIAPCHGATFGRRHELRRHFASVHDLRNARFWCPVHEYERSKDGGRAFPRKDKMIDHLMRVHADKVGSAA